jgi:hypothetical protein
MVRVKSKIAGKPAAVLLLQFFYKPYMAVRQNLLYKNKKNRYAVFFHAVFWHFLPACLS